ncbi:hypothetical protein FKP32DRAFT_1246365 [Trametes sanguinea]|nr:hypothetical protein FKP32DRAFT_1246365 [Trametes sanguinea]
MLICARPAPSPNPGTHHSCANADLDSTRDGTTGPAQYHFAWVSALTGRSHLLFQPYRTLEPRDETPRTISRAPSTAPGPVRHARRRHPSHVLTRGRFREAPRSSFSGGSIRSMTAGGWVPKAARGTRIGWFRESPYTAPFVRSCQMHPYTVHEGTRCRDSRPRPRAPANASTPACNSHLPGSYGCSALLAPSDAFILVFPADARIGGRGRRAVRCACPSPRLRLMGPRRPPTRNCVGHTKRAGRMRRRPIYPLNLCLPSSV